MNLFTLVINRGIFFTCCICFFLTFNYTLLCQAQETDEGLSGFDEISEFDDISGFDDLETTDDISGFGDLETADDFSEVEDSLTEINSDKPTWWALDGFLRVGSAYNFDHNAPKSGEPDYRGLSKLRTTIKLEIPFTLPYNWKGNISGQAFYDFAYSFKDRNNFTNEMLDLYEEETELREAYISGSILPNLDIKIGRQIIVWGFADYIRVVDVLNPLDNRQPGLIDIEDLRLPIAMSKVDYYYKNWSFMGVAVHEVEFNKDPLFNSDFFPADRMPPHEDIPATNLRNTEFGIAITGAFNGWDIGFYFAHMYDDLMSLDAGELRNLELNHSVINMGGIGFNYVIGNWFLRAEAALLDGFEFAHLPDETRSRLDAMIGFDYVGFRDTTITLEAVHRHINNFESELKDFPDYALEDLTQYVMTYSRDFLRERLHFGAQFSFFGSRGHQGNIQRYSIDYDLYDAVSANFGVLTFHSGSDFFITKAFEDNDRIFFGAKYSF